MRETEYYSVSSLWQKKAPERETFSHNFSFIFPFSLSSPSQFLMQRRYWCKTLSYLNCLRPRGKHCLCFPGTVLCNVQRRNNICLKADFGLWTLDLHLSALPFALPTSFSVGASGYWAAVLPKCNAKILSKSTATTQCNEMQKYWGAALPQRNAMKCYWL